MPRGRRANIGRRTKHASQQQVYSQNLSEERQNIIRENARLRQRVSTRRSLASYNDAPMVVGRIRKLSSDNNSNIWEDAVKAVQTQMNNDPEMKPKSYKNIPRERFSTPSSLYNHIFNAEEHAVDIPDTESELNDFEQLLIKEELDYESSVVKLEFEPISMKDQSNPTTIKENLLCNPMMVKESGCDPIKSKEECDMTMIKDQPVCNPMVIEEGVNEPVEIKDQPVRNPMVIREDDNEQIVIEEENHVKPKMIKNNAGLKRKMTIESHQSQSLDLPYKHPTKPKKTL